MEEILDILNQREALLLKMNKQIRDTYNNETNKEFVMGELGAIIRETEFIQRLKRKIKKPNYKWNYLKLVK